MTKIKLDLSQEEIRDGLTNIVILTAALFVTAALLGSLLRVKQIGLQPIMFLHMMITVIITSLYLFRHRLPLMLRAHVISGCFFIAGVAGILSFGLASAGTLLLFGSCVLSSFLVNRRTAVVYGVSGGLLLISQMVLALTGQLRYSIPLGDYLTSTSAWINNLIAYTYLTTIYLLLIQRFIGYLNKLVETQDQHIQSQSEHISQTEIFLDVVINSLPYGILWKDSELRYLGANQRYLDDIKVNSLSDILGKTDFEIMPSSIAEQFQQIDRQVLADDCTVNYEDKRPDENGRMRYGSVSRIQLKAKDGKLMGILSAYSDITERIEMEMDMRDAKSSAELASKAKSQFLANMSHEIRTPLNGITGLIELCLSTDLDKVQFEYLKKADLSAKTLLNIINDVLDISKIEAGQVQLEQKNFTLDEILAHINSQFTLQANEKNIEFEVQYQGTSNLWLLGDPTRLLQILMNLCSNSVKFTEEGHVTLVCHAEQKTNEVAVHFDIQDTGIGIKETILPGLFDSFTQADSSINRKFGGTGLGLAIVKALVDIMGGSLRAESVLGKGSQFTVDLTLPLGKKDQMLTTRIAEDIQLTGKHILLVEDNEINQVIANEMLTQAGAIVECAEDGKIGLEKMEEHTFDLVLMDIQMPVMDGCTAIVHIRESHKWQNLPVIALTANVMLHDIEKYKNLGFTDHIAKPFERDHLLSTLSHHLKAQH
jgi:PAS domain S-box-containing protein